MVVKQHGYSILTVVRVVWSNLWRHSNLIWFSLYQKIEFSHFLSAFQVFPWETSKETSLPLFSCIYRVCVFSSDIKVTGSSPLKFVHTLLITNILNAERKVRINKEILAIYLFVRCFAFFFYEEVIKSQHDKYSIFISLRRNLKWMVLRKNQ